MDDSFYAIIEIKKLQLDLVTSVILLYQDCPGTGIDKIFHHIYGKTLGASFFVVVVCQWFTDCYNTVNIRDGPDITISRGV